MDLKRRRARLCGSKLVEAKKRPGSTRVALIEAAALVSVCCRACAITLADAKPNPVVREGTDRNSRRSAFRA